MNLYNILGLNQQLVVTLWPSDDQELSFESHIKDIDAARERFLIDLPPQNQPELADAMIPQTVIGLTIHASKGLLIVYPTVGPLQKIGLEGYWLLLSANDKYELVQRREHVRVSYLEELTIAPLDTETTDKPFEAVGHNLSGGGIRFSTGIELEPGDIVGLLLRLNDDAVSVKASVISTFENTQRFVRRVDRYITTCSFVDITLEDQDKIIQECFRRQLRGKSRQKGG